MSNSTLDRGIAGFSTMLLVLAGLMVAAGLVMPSAAAGPPAGFRSLGGPAKPTMDDVKRAADEYNKMGELSANAGIQQGLHNEDFELTVVDGKRTYDLLLELLAPKLVQFQFQVSTISRGYDAAEYLTKYPGRFFSMHVQGWSAQTKKIMPVGQDTLDWKKIFTAAKTAGVKNYFVEMNLDMMKASVPYLHSLQV